MSQWICFAPRSPTRRPQGGGYRSAWYDFAMGRYPKLPPRLDRLYVANPVYFVTFCTYRRRPLLATAAVQGAFVGFAEHAFSTGNIAVGRYVIMPNHVHLFVCGPDDFDLGRWVGMLKQHLAKAINKTGDDAVWQRGFFDHLLRGDESYGQKWEYVKENPVRANLTSGSDVWPYAGEIVVIDRV